MKDARTTIKRSLPVNSVIISIDRISHESTDRRKTFFFDVVYSFQGEKFRTKIKDHFSDNHWTYNKNLPHKLNCNKV